jgi:hypothetical protein
MCFRVFEQQNRDVGEETGSTHFPQFRPRRVGAAVAILAAAVFGALVAVPAIRDASAVERTAGPQRVATAVPQQIAIEKASNTTLPADDGVPTPTEVSMAAGHHCEHGL